MVMLNKAVNHIKQFPRRVSDTDTHPQEQTAKYIITQTVNQMNMIMSETYAYSNTVADMGYHTNMKLAANKK